METTRLGELARRHARPRAVARSGSRRPPSPEDVPWALSLWTAEGAGLGQGAQTGPRSDGARRYLGTPRGRPRSAGTWGSSLPPPSTGQGHVLGHFQPRPALIRPQRVNRLRSVGSRPRGAWAVAAGRSASVTPPIVAGFRTRGP